MSPLTLFLAGLVTGTLFAAVSLGVLARRMRASIVRRLRTHVAPVLERRARALGIATPSAPEVSVGHDGDLELQHHDDLARWIALADAIAEREHAPLGFVDTIRVSKEDVNEELAARLKAARDRDPS